MGSTTADFLKYRVSTPTIGKWSSKFSAVKKFAINNNIPLIAIWSNGDACGHCLTLEKALMRKTFRTWMASSNFVFYFGCCTDTSKDDKYEGIGFNWCRKNNLKQYPFVRVYWKNGKVDTAMTGDTLLNY